MRCMRGKFLRLLILLAVGIAAPIQGVVAATAGLCAMQSHDAGHDHEGDGGSAGSPVHDEGKSNHHGHCAPCVACCAAVAIASTLRPVFRPVPASAPEILAMPAPAGVQPDALERPPLAG
jgi:hypothetical protein